MIDKKSHLGLVTLILALRITFTIYIFFKTNLFGKIDKELSKNLTHFDSSFEMVEGSFFKVIF